MVTMMVDVMIIVAHCNLDVVVEQFVADAADIGGHYLRKKEKQM